MVLTLKIAWRRSGSQGIQLQETLCNRNCFQVETSEPPGTTDYRRIVGTFIEYHNRWAWCTFDLGTTV